MFVLFSLLLLKLRKKVFVFIDFWIYKNYTRKYLLMVYSIEFSDQSGKLKLRTEWPSTRIRWKYKKKIFSIIFHYSLLKGTYW